MPQPYTQIRAKGGSIQDFPSRASFDLVLGELPSPSAQVNNAGVGRFTPLLGGTDPEEVERCGLAKLGGGQDPTSIAVTISDDTIYLVRETQQQSQ